ncbi:glycoside hydrolase family 99-like domain-containing protein [Acinetobacter junii]|uniref:glycosyltransferase WbsX family protein n=1 Tax=Acinetobacter junii TaxID=40215 RepID=UPI000579CC42|nr:glycoside hydrolase family 99-like domain-containing protein [Acinetobacter junii]
MKKVVLSYYLPQFHEIEENNLWWGEGFTEWTKINQAIAYSKSHQIRKPIQPLGQYNLLNKKVVEQQYNIANEYGIDGFLIWNYWFGGGDKLLEKPLELILNENAKVKYCLAWANHSWLNKTKGILLKEQKYLGKEDYTKYFNYLLPFFKSENYIKKDNKPVFFIFRPQDIPDLNDFMTIFEELSLENGLAGIYWIAENTDNNADYVNKFDGFLNSGKFLNLRKYKTLTFIREKINNFTKGRFKLGPFFYSYKRMVMLEKNLKNKSSEIPVIFTGWDTSIRHATNGIVLNEFDPHIFKEHVSHNLASDSDFLVVKSWNEWAEGNLLEPDTIYGYELLKIMKEYFN